MKASIYTLQLETISFLLIPFWVIITELQHQAMKESSKLPLDPLTLFTNFYADDFDHVPELQWDILHCPPEGYGTTLILSVKKQQQQQKNTENMEGFEKNLGKREQKQNKDTHTQRMSW